MTDAKPKGQPLQRVFLGINETPYPGRLTFEGEGELRHWKVRVQADVGAWEVDVRIEYPDRPLSPALVGRAQVMGMESDPAHQWTVLHGIGALRQVGAE